MRKLVRLLFSGAIPAPWDIWNWFWLSVPWLAGVAAVIAGSFQNIPWMWVIMAAALTVAGTGHALVQWSKWQQSRRVAEKLTFDAVRIGKKFDGTALVLGFALENSAEFPLDCEVVAIQSRIGNRVPTKEVKLPQVFRVPAKGMLWFDDAQIEIDTPQKGSAEGLLSFEVRYGRGERRKEVVRMKKNVRLGFDDNGLLLGANWNDDAGK